MVDVFYHRWNRKAENHCGPVECLQLDTDSTSLDDILADFREEYGTTGSHHTSGIFEIQTDTGIYRRWDGRSFAKRPQTAQFFTWEELEVIELQGLEMP
jgi:hypothetical protein